MNLVADRCTFARGTPSRARHRRVMSQSKCSGFCRCQLFILSQSEQVLLLVLHHIAADGWSLGLLGRDLPRAYAARVQGAEAQWPALPIQYADYTLCQQQLLGSETDPQSPLGGQIAFWTKTLERLPEQLELPTDRPRPAFASYRGETVPLQISPDLHGRLLGLAREHQASLFVVLHAGLAALLSRLGAGTDIAIGSPIAGRTDEALEELIGFFVNTLVLRTDISANPSFSELLARVRAVDLAAYAHQELPFERLVELLNPVRSLARHPLFQVMLVFQNTPEPVLELPGIVARREPVAIDTAKFDLSLSLSERRAADGRPQGIEGLIEYRTDLFERSSVEAVGRRLTALLEAVVADPGQPIGRIELLTPKERRQLLFERNATACDLPQVTLPASFEAQVERGPEAIALVFEESALSYGELNAQANRLAHYLTGRGIRPENLVALALSRSIEMIIALLGILKAGAAYLPLDPGYPVERLAYMLRDAQPACVLTNIQIAERLLESVTQFLLDHPETAGALAQSPETNPSDAERAGLLTLQSPAYVIYTSGSTGTPKGVIVSHGAIVNRLVWMQSAYKLQSDDRVLQKTPFGFDVSVWEFFWPLAHGATLVVARPEGHKALPAPDFALANGRWRAARSPHEEILSSLFTEVLGVPQVGIEDNFLELGGHSVLATRLISRIRSAFGIDLPIRGLFEAPSVAGLLERLDLSTNQKSIDVIVPLRPYGNLLPLFCVHPAGGLSWCYSGLLQHIRGDYPIYGLQARSFNPPEILPQTLQEMVADYLDQIRAIQPGGPYHLLGWSFGGLVACSLASHLQLQGEQVALLALLDTYPPDPEPPRDLPDEQEMMKKLLKDLGYDPATLGEGPLHRNVRWRSLNFRDGRGRSRATNRRLATLCPRTDHNSPNRLSPPRHDSARSG
jgi:non-ribosomal peptide synthetase component F/pimeloyl-ACP methyl ester carboxylesterase